MKERFGGVIIFHLLAIFATFNGETPLIFLVRLLKDLSEILRFLLIPFRYILSIKLSNFPYHIFYLYIYVGRGRIGGINSLCFSLIHCEYIYTKANLTFLIDYNSIRQVSY